MDGTELNNAGLKMSKFEFSTRLVSFIVAIAMLVVDKGMGLMVTSPSDWYYGILMGYGVAGVSLIDKISGLLGKDK